MKKLLILGLFLLLAVQAGAAVTTTGRFWWYLNVTTQISPQWSIVVMPGHRYEFYRDTGTAIEAKGNVLAECYIGPTYTMKLGENGKLKFAAWYYYLGYPSATSYTSSHNLWLAPTIEYKWDKLTLSDRLVLHNTFYADGYASDADKAGYSLLVREMVSVAYKLLDNLSVSCAEEIFVGAVGPTNGAAPKSYGFVAPGFQTNRVYAGATYTINPIMSLVPQYVLETSYSTDGLCTLTTMQHYIFVTLNISIKAFK